MAFFSRRSRAWRATLLAVVLVALGVVARPFYTSRDPDTAVPAPPKPGEQPPEPDFRLSQMQTMPYGLARFEDGIKPQHWTWSQLEVEANRQDFQGSIQVELTSAEGLLPLQQSAYQLNVQRDVVLPLKERRRLEQPLFCPSGPGQLTPLRSAIELRQALGRLVLATQSPQGVVPEHQYHFVVLTAKPDAYRYLLTLDSVNAPLGEYGLNQTDAHYRLSYLAPGPVALPPSSLFWTSTAYLLWDQRDPADLDLAQQQALIDWLYWGGQLLISGPDTLEQLQRSFLADYLPATTMEEVSLEAEALAPLTSFALRWKGQGPRTTDPWRAAKLLLHAEAECTEGTRQTPLVAERSIGRGRVVVSAFALSQPALIEWPLVDTWYNAVLLRREGRRFYISPSGDLGVQFVQRETTPPEVVSQLRFFTRDEPSRHADTGVVIQASDLPELDEAAEELDYAFTAQGSWGNDAPAVGSGVAAWNDRSPVTQLCYSTLRQASGIVIPSRAMVMRYLLAYLAVLVPLNWLVFRLLRRVEYAWVVAPLVTIAFAGGIVRMAQLDIGFGRSRNQVEVLEMYANHPRGHLTSYCALHSSLGSRYEATLESPYALMLPFAMPSARNGESDLDRWRLSFTRAPQPGEPTVQMSGLSVGPNTAAHIHSEEWFDTQGAWRVESLGGNSYRVTNQTTLNLVGAGVVLDSLAIWLGPLAAGEQREFTLVPQNIRAAWPRAWNQMADQPQVGSLELQNLLLFAGGTSEPGELRLVGWTEQAHGSLRVTPHTSQGDEAALVVVHLQRGGQRPIQSDYNTRAQVQKPKAAALPSSAGLKSQANSPDPEPELNPESDPVCP